MALYRAAFEQSGIIEVTDVDDLADRAHALLTGRRPGGNRVAVISMSGGAGVLMADHCAAAGLELPTLSPDTLERLRAILPAFAGLNNPIDVTGNVSAREGSFVEALELILADPLVDMLGICLASISGPAGTRSRSTSRGSARPRPNRAGGWCADVEHPRGLRGAGRRRHARYDTPVRCARGMDACGISNAPAAITNGSAPSRCCAWSARRSARPWRACRPTSPSIRPSRCWPTMAFRSRAKRWPPRPNRRWSWPRRSAFRW
jgi:acyl-CoA synthetase (NDP forming)